MLRSSPSAVCLMIAACAFAQTQPAQQKEEPPPAEQPADQYFSGTVIAYAEDKLTVARTVLGKNSSSRSFKIGAETQVDGKLRLNVRVTVQYITKDEVDQAVHIIVRNPTPKK